MPFPEDPTGKYFRLSDKSHPANGEVMRCVEIKHHPEPWCEEPGGTDWYRFDRGFEFGGSGLSTIPQIWGTRGSMTFEPEITREKQEAEAKEKLRHEGHNRRYARHAARSAYSRQTKEQYTERNRRIFIWRFRGRKTYSWIAFKFGISAGRVQGICQRMQTAGRYSKQTAVRHRKRRKAQSAGRPIPFAEPRGQWIVATHECVTVCQKEGP